jgi:hypothetical protein
MTTTDLRDALVSFAGAPLDPRTYRSLVYLLLAVPIGLGYLLVLSVAGSLSLGLSVTLLGPVAVLGSLLLVVTLAWGDAALTARLLDVDVEPWFPSREDGVVAFCRRLLLDRSTWTGLAYLCWRVALALVALIVLTTGVSLTTGLLAAPLAYGEHLRVDYLVGVYRVTTLPRALVAAGVGLLVGVCTLYAVNLLGRLSVLVATTLVDPGAAGSDGSPIDA